MTRHPENTRDQRIERAIELELERRTIQHSFRTPGIGRRLADIGLEYDRLLGSVADELGLTLSSIYTSVALLADKEE